MGVFFTLHLICVLFLHPFLDLGRWSSSHSFSSIFWVFSHSIHVVQKPGDKKQPVQRYQGDDFGQYLFIFVSILIFSFIFYWTWVHFSSYFIGFGTMFLYLLLDLGGSFFIFYSIWGHFSWSFMGFDVIFFMLYWIML